MGVKGLWKLLKPTARPVTPETLEGLVLGVDVSIWLNQAIKGMRDRKGNEITNAHLLVLFNRICKLLHYRIKPIFVFDGAPPPLKSKTLAVRRKRKQKASDEVNSLLGKRALKVLEVHALQAVTGQETKLKVPKFSDSRKDDEDIYQLPEPEVLSGDSNKEDSPDFEEDIVTYPLLHERFRVGNESVDIDSDTFSALPPEVQHDLLLEKKESQKHTYTNPEILPKKADDFSSYQLTRLKNRNNVTRKLVSVRKTLNASHSASYGIPEGRDCDIEARRIESAEGRHYVLIRGKNIGSDHHEGVKTDDDFLRMDFRSEEVRAIAAGQDGGSSTQDEVRVVGEDISDGWQPPQSDILEMSIGADQSSTDSNDEGETDHTTTTIDTTSITPPINQPLQLQEQIQPSTAGIADTLPSAITGVMDGEGKISTHNQLSSHDTTTTPLTTDTSTSHTNLIQPTDHPAPVSSSTEQSNSSLLSSTKESTDPNAFGSMEQSISPLPSSGVKQSTDIQSSTSTIPIDSTSLVPTSHHSNAEHSTNTTVQSTDPTQYTTDFNSSITLAQPIDVSSPNKLPPTLSDIPAAHDDDVLTQPVVLSSSSDSESDSFEEVSNTCSSVVNPPSPSPPPPVSPSAAPVEPVCPVIVDREYAETVLLEARELLNTGNNMAANQGDVGSTVVEEAMELERRAVQWERQSTNVSNVMYQEAQELLKLFGLPYMVSPSEAEAQCAMLESLSLTQGSITDDNDVLLFGGQKVYRNMFSPNEDIELYSNKDISSLLGLDRDKLIVMAYLLGSDYTNGVEGVGCVNAMELIQLYTGEGLEPLQKIKDRNMEVKVKPGLQVKETAIEKKVRSFELSHDFPNEAVRMAYTHPSVDSSTEAFEWGRPDLDLLRQFTLHKFGWGQQQCDSVLVPVIKRCSTDLNKQQMAITSFTVPTSSSLNPAVGIFGKSKRLRNAVARLSSQTIDQNNESSSETSSRGGSSRGRSSKRRSSIGTSSRGVSSKRASSRGTSSRGKSNQRGQKSRGVSGRGRGKQTTSETIDNNSTSDEDDLVLGNHGSKRRCVTVEDSSTSSDSADS